MEAFYEDMSSLNSNLSSLNISHNLANMSKQLVKEKHTKKNKKLDSKPILQFHVEKVSSNEEDSDDRTSSRNKRVSDKKRNFSSSENLEKVEYKKKKMQYFKEKKNKHLSGDSVVQQEDDPNCFSSTLMCGGGDDDDDDIDKLGAHVNVSSNGEGDNSVSTNRQVEKKRLSGGVFKDMEGLVYYLESNKRALLRCLPDSTIYFKGNLNIQVIHGSIQIAGYCVNRKEKHNIKVYSLTAYNYYPIHIKDSGSSKFKSTSIQKCLKDLDVCDNNLAAIMKDLHPSECLLYVYSTDYPTNSENNQFCQSNDRVKFHMIQKLAISIPNMIPKNSYFRKASNVVNLLEKHLNIQIFKTISEIEGAPLHTEPSEWDGLFSKISKSERNPRVVLCGGSGLGKTTLLRYLVNRSIKQWGKAVVLDFDPGQSEFNLPGTLSATLIKDPVFGPNFTHILPAEKCFFLGDIKANTLANHYIEMINAIVGHCASSPKFDSIPWFINTMGYIKDIGLLLNCRIIHDVQPSHVVQIQSIKSSQNLPDILSASYVKKNMWNTPPPQKTNLDFELLLVDSVKNKHLSNMNSTLKSADKRKNVLMSYFSQMFNTVQKEYSVNQLTPYACNIRHLQIDSCMKPGQMNRTDILIAMNGELVALCCGNKNNENIPNYALPCLGYGIVHCIDPARKELYLLTPLPLSSMAKVKTLLLGSSTISLPRKLLDPRCKELFNKRLPYTVTGEIRQRTSHLPRRNYRQPSRKKETPS